MSEDKQKQSNASLSLAERLITTVINIVETYIKVFKLEIKTSISDTLALVIIILSIFTFFSLAFAFFSVSLALVISYGFNWPYFIGFGSVGLLWIFALIGAIMKRGFIYNKMLQVIDQEIEQRSHK